MKNFAVFLLASCAMAQTAIQPWTKQPIDTVNGGSVDGAAVAAPKQVQLRINRSTVIDFKQGFRRVSVTNGEIAEAVAVSSTELLLNGKSGGDTSLIIWDKAGNRTAYEVHVAADTALVDAVRDQIKREVGDGVTLDIQGQNVFLRGTVRDTVAADRAAAIAGTAGKVVNLLEVSVPPADSQILLKVRFASVDRSVASQLGVNLFSGKYTKGNVSTTTNQFGSVAPNGVLSGSGSNFNISDLLNILYYRPDIDMGAILKDLETKSVLQILAEPNVLAMSGHPASFLAGGEFPFPTLQGGGSGVGQVTIQFREFGIRLKFLPEITPRGTIHLKVEPEVSSLDYSNGLTVSGFTIPGLSTRRIQTEMELENGQSFAIAGLLDAQTSETLDRMPGIGNIPILGKLFQSRSITKNKGELLILVTPELVHAIPAAETLPNLDTPKKFIPGDLPKDWTRPMGTAEAESALPRVTSLPVEQIKALEQPAGTNGSSGPAYTPGIPANVPGLPQAPQASSKQ
jgi:pilus assembly protein CpaC